MKKKLLAGLAVLMWLNAAQGAQISWANDPEIYDWSGAANLVLETYTSYIVRLYESTDGSINFGIAAGIATNLSDDVYTGYSFNWASGGLDGLGAMNVLNSDTLWGINAGDQIYSVIFSSSSTTSGYYAVVDSALATVTYPAGNMTYNPGGVNGGLQPTGDWVAIPEPATAVLFGIGSMGAWLLRRSRKAAQEQAEG